MANLTKNAAISKLAVVPDEVIEDLYHKFNLSGATTVDDAREAIKTHLRGLPGTDSGLTDADFAIPVPAPQPRPTNPPAAKKLPAWAIAGIALGILIAIITCYAIFSNLPAAPADAAAKIELSSKAELAATEGEAMKNVKLTVKGGKSPYEFKKVDGPSWVSVAKDGTITGTPAKGTSTLKVLVTDANGETANVSVNLKVAAKAAAVDNTNANDNANGNDGGSGNDNGNGNANANDNTAPDLTSVEAPAMPDGLTNCTEMEKFIEGAGTEKSPYIYPSNWLHDTCKASAGVKRNIMVCRNGVYGWSEGYGNINVCRGIRIHRWFCF